MYLIYDEKVANNPAELGGAYESGFILGRKQPAYLYQTRSLRIHLPSFSLSSENRRVLGKYQFELQAQALPIPADQYDWRLHKQGKDFYEQKFADVEFSAHKLKQLLTTDYYFNLLLTFRAQAGEFGTGHTIALRHEAFLHYCYPFYDLQEQRSNLGMYMMLRAIAWAQSQGLNYVYLGGATRSGDLYKLQFAGLEWWDQATQGWNSDTDSLKTLLSQAS